MKPRLGQGRVGLRCKIKTPILINKPMVQTTESPSKVLAPKSPKTQNAFIPSYIIPQMKSSGDASSRKSIQDVSREMSIYPDLV